MPINEGLKTVPTFNFSQGDYLEENTEIPLTVSYYHSGIVEIEQEGNSIIIRIDHIQKLASLIKKYNTEAQINLAK